MNYIQVGLSISVFLACCAYVRAFVLPDSGSKGGNHHSNDIENRILFLAKFLEEMGVFSDNVESPRHIVSQSGKDNPSSDHGFKDVGNILKPLTATNERDINVDKKDYAILPPASEWCRMMGFRRCRGSSS